MKGKLLKKLVAGTMSALILSGGIPAEPIADILRDITLTASADVTLSGEGTYSAPYLIQSADDWNYFTQSINDGNTYKYKYLQLTSDISASTMAGTSSHPFEGNFIGNGHTLTVSYDTDEEICAPFRYISGARIVGLTTEGTISTSKKYAGGIVGLSGGASYIYGCRSSVEITSSVSGDGTHGGLVGVIESGAEIYFENCLFDGSVSGSNTSNCGGFLGWCNGYCSIINCLMTGEMNIDLDSGSAIFSRNTYYVYCKNCFYTGSYTGASVQGTQTDKSGRELCALLGQAWTLSGNDVVPVSDDRNLCTVDIYGIENEYAYTGSPIDTEYTVSAMNGKILQSGVEFTASLKLDGTPAAAVKDIGIYTLTLTGIEAAGYTGEISYRFAVTAPKAPSTPAKKSFTASSVTVSWTQPDTASDWTVQYSADSTFQTGVRSVNASGTPEATLSALTPDTTYYVRVKALAGNVSGEWSGVYSFEFSQKLGIGTESSTSNEYTPTNIFYNYSLSEQIYTSDEIGTAGTIKSVDYKMTGQSNSQTRSIALYMINTQKTSFTGYNDWVVVSESDKVFEGSVEFKGGQWTTITLDTPFEYDGVSNLLLIFDDNTGSYVNGYSFLYTGCSNVANLTYYNDNVNVDPTAEITETASSTYSGKTSIRLGVDFKNTVTVDGTIENGTLSVDKEKAVWGETVTITAAPALGYKVSSVSVNDGTINVTSAGSGKYTFEMPNDEAFVSATFVESDPCTVRWLAPDGTELQSINGVITGTSPSFTGELPEIEHYHFAGWDPEEGPVYEDTAYTAVYEPDFYTVTFDEGGGSTTTQDVEYLGKITYYEPDNDDMNFTGWYLGDDPFDPDTPIEGPVTLTAGWEIAVKYSVTLISYNKTNTISVKSGAVIPAAYQTPAARYGFVFNCWYNGETLFSVNTPITEDITLNASWSEDPNFNGVYVTFMDGDTLCGKVGIDTYTYGDTIEDIPDLPEDRDGLTCLGWYTEYGADLLDVFIYGTSITVYSKWGVAEDTVAMLKGSNLILGDDIGINFYVDLSDHVFTSVDSKMVVTVDAADKTKTIEIPVTEIVSDQNLRVDENGTTIYIFPCHIPAKDMTAGLSVCVIDGSTGKSSAVYEYTVDQYARAIIADPGQYGDRTVDLVKAMLYYGGAAQTLLIDPTPADEDLASSAVPGYEPVALPARFDESQFDMETLTAEAAKFGMTPRYASLVLESKTTLRLYFTPGTFAPDLFDEDGNYYKPFVKGSEICYDINTFSPGEIFESKTLSFDADNAQTFGVCIGRYANRALDSGDDKLVSAVRALYNYDEYAKAYLDQNYVPGIG